MQRLAVCLCDFMFVCCLSSSCFCLCMALALLCWLVSGHERPRAWLSLLDGRRIDLWLWVTRFFLHLPTPVRCRSVGRLVGRFVSLSASPSLSVCLIFDVCFKFVVCLSVCLTIVVCLPHLRCLSVCLIFGVCLYLTLIVCLSVCLSPIIVGLSVPPSLSVVSAYSLLSIPFSRSMSVCRCLANAVYFPLTFNSIILDIYWLLPVSH